MSRTDATRKNIEKQAKKQQMVITNGDYKW
jgi:hypothetical protein